MSELDSSFNALMIYGMTEESWSQISGMQNSHRYPNDTNDLDLTVMSVSSNPWIIWFRMSDKLARICSWHPSDITPIL